MGGPHPWPGFRRRVAEQGDYIEEVYRRVVDEGPLVAGDLKARVGKKGTWWDHDDGKTALEALFFTGRVAARRRPQDFARVYDLPERIIPAEALARPALPAHDARKELLVRAAKYHGVGTLPDLADYHRLTPTGASPRWRSSWRRVACFLSPCRSGTAPRTSIPTRVSRARSMRVHC